MQIETVRECVSAGKVNWTDHVRQRMEQRGLSKEEVLKCILQGEIIEEYPNDYPFPSCLIFGSILRKVLHVVVGYDNAGIYVVTVYIPNETKFEMDLKTRRVK